MAVALWVELPSTGSSSGSGGPECGNSVELGRFNCIPEGGKTETKETCEKRGCCWTSSRGSKTGSPRCFYPEEFGYTVDGSVQDTATGERLNVTRKSGQPSQYGNDVDTLRVDIYYETPHRLRVKVRSLVHACMIVHLSLRTTFLFGAQHFTSPALLS